MWGITRAVFPRKTPTQRGLLYVSSQSRHARRFSATSGLGGGSLMNTSCLSETQLEVRDAVFKVCSDFPDEYWAHKDDTATYPLDFHAAIAKAGFIGCALPEDLGGSGLGISEATAILHAIAESGAGFAGAQTIHANIYATQPIAKFATPAQKATMLPDIISGKCRTCFAVTEPGSGLDTLSLRTTARPNGKGGYSVNGSKIWISSAQVAGRMVLLARTGKAGEGRRGEGLSLFCVPVDGEQKGLRMGRIEKMGGRAVDANEVFFEGYEVGEETRIGAEGEGFRIVLHGMNAERCLIAGEALGLGYVALRKAVEYVKQREVFGRAVGGYQGIAHPLAEAWMGLEAAKEMTYRAARLYDQSRLEGNEGTFADVGVACNAAKYLAAEAAFTACERAVLSMGGMGYARDYHVERYLRECFVPRIAPVSREMIKNFVGEKALGLPRNY